jgi:homoserine acetyltransferase
MPVLFLVGLWVRDRRTNGLRSFLTSWILRYHSVEVRERACIIRSSWKVSRALYAALGTSSAGVAQPDLQTAQGKKVTFSSETREAGLKALGRVYAGWGFSQAFYREKLYETAPALGFKNLDDFLVNFWEAWALSKDPENMLVMAHTWQAGDCSQQEPYHGDFEKAMKGIKAKTLVLPAKTDLYFPPEDSEIEVQNMKPGVGTLKIFPSIWGHWYVLFSRIIACLELTINVGLVGRASPRKT